MASSSIRVHFLTRRTHRSVSFVYPLRVFQRALRQHGIQVRLFYDDHASELLDCDVLAVVSDYYIWKNSTKLDTPPAPLAALERFRKNVQHIIWLDNSDGTSPTFPDAFGYVDVYAKKQLLVDRALYRQTFHERNYHLDFYYKTYRAEVMALGAPAETPYHRGLEPEEIAKLALSWNLGMGDFRGFFGLALRRARSYFPITYYAAAAQRAQRDRSIDLTCRLHTDYAFPGVVFHRTKILELIDHLAQTSHKDFTFRYEGKVSFRDYRAELADARIAPSPFGFGEVCWRDFEIFLAGAAMIKPDMSHLETYPDVFEAGVTYVPHKWDFSNLRDQLCRLLDNSDYARSIAQAGQQRYLELTKGSLASTRFVEHFQTLLHRLDD